MSFVKRLKPHFLLYAALTVLTLLLPVRMYSLQYTVKPNDTLWGIAKAHSIPVDSLTRLNDLVKESVYPGQKLIIPERIVKYSVQKDDNLTVIAQKLGSRVEYIVVFNNLPTETVYEDQVLLVPVTENRSVKNQNQDKEKPVTKNNPQTVIHVVKTDETLYSLARKYNTTVDSIKNLNGKKNTTLYAGEKLKIEPGIMDTIEKPLVILHNNDQKPAVSNTVKTVNAVYRRYDSFPVDKNSLKAYQYAESGLWFTLKQSATVYSIDRGTVVFTGLIPGYNNVVIMEYSDNRRAVYGGMTSLFVSKGTLLKNGDALGMSGYSISRAGYRLYFEIRKGKSVENIVQAFPFLKNVSVLEGNN